MLHLQNLSVKKVFLLNKQCGDCFPMEEIQMNNNEQIFLLNNFERLSLIQGERFLFWEEYIKNYFFLILTIYTSSTVDENQIFLELFSQALTCDSHKIKKKITCPYFACDSLYKRKANVPFLKEILTGNVEQILYYNVNLKIWWRKRNTLLTTVDEKHNFT